MQFPNKLQAAVLFDGPVGVFEGAVQDFAPVAEAKLGSGFNVPERNPGKFYRLFGGGELMRGRVFGRKGL